MNAKVCVSISGIDTVELLDKAQRAERSSADLIEVRLDALSRHNGLAKIAESVNKPLIATKRALSDKGAFDGSEDDRLKALVRAVEDGFSHVDLELRTPGLAESIDTFRQKGTRVILSHHDFHRTPSLTELHRIKAELETFQPDFCKIVTTAKSLEDNFTVLSLLGKNDPQSIPLVSFAMGEAGIWSRVIAPFYGAAFTYASLERGSETAPGQPPISDLRTIYRALHLE